jgi:hypothetical protein
MPQAGVVVLLDVHSDLIARGNTTIDQLSTCEPLSLSSRGSVRLNLDAPPPISPEPRTTFQSDQSYSRFGQFVAFGDLK